MKNSKIAALAATLCLGAATAVLAQPGGTRWDSLGTVDVDARRGPDRGAPGMDRDVRNFDLGGPVERLQFRAERSDINCRSIRARYGNDRPGRGGRNDQIFSGMLREGRTVNVDVPPPGRGRELDGLVFNCEALGRRDGVIRISAEVGRYRNNWMRGPNWERTWSRMFNWGSNVANNWQPVGRESFEGRGDSEVAFAGLRGRNVDSIALMPVNADARCSRVEAEFGNGRRQRLNINNGDFLRRGQYAQIDLPGNVRNVESLHLRCSAVNAGRVEIALYTSR